jgi:hypothetical protein
MRFSLMDKDELIKKLKERGFKKLTGPPEDWLKSFVNMSWGFRDKERLRKEWEKINENDIFIFHSMKPEYLDFEIQTGIIGLGIVKETKIGIDEDKGFEPPNLRPLRIIFKETWWFGDYDKIVREKFSVKMQKGDSYLMKEMYLLVKNCITFKEMRENDCLISTQGAIQNVSKEKQDRLIKLIIPRLREPT